MPKAVALPDGSFVSIREGEDAQQAWVRAQEMYPEAFQIGRKKEEKKPEGGFKAAFSAGLSRMGGEAALTAGKAGIIGLPEAEAIYKRQGEKAEKIFKPTDDSWFESPWQKLKETAGGSAAYMLAPAAAGAAALAAPVLAPGAAAALGGAGVIGTGLAGLAGLGQYTGSNLAAQMEEGKKGLAETSGLAAVGAAVPQAALDVLSFKMVPGVARIFKSVGKEVTEESAKKIAEQTLKQKLADYTLATGKTMGIEGTTEVAQDILEKLQAGASLTDPKAREQYLESFLGGAFLGGALAPAGRMFERSGIKAEGERLKGVRLASEKEAADKAAAESANEFRLEEAVGPDIPDALKQQIAQAGLSSAQEAEALAKGRVNVSPVTTLQQQRDQLLAPIKNALDSYDRFERIYRQDNNVAALEQLQQQRAKLLEPYKDRLAEIDQQIAQAQQASGLSAYAQAARARMATEDAADPTLALKRELEQLDDEIYRAETVGDAGRVAALNERKIELQAQLKAAAPETAFSQYEDLRQKYNAAKTLDDRYKAALEIGQKAGDTATLQSQIAMANNAMQAISQRISTLESVRQQSPNKVEQDALAQQIEGLKKQLDSTKIKAAALNDALSLNATTPDGQTVLMQRRAQAVETQKQIEDALKEAQKQGAAIRPKAFDSLLADEKRAIKAQDKAAEEGDVNAELAARKKYQAAQAQLGLFGMDQHTARAAYQEREMAVGDEIQRLREEAQAKRDQLAAEIEALQRMGDRKNDWEYARLVAEEARLARVIKEMERTSLPGGKSGVTEQYDMFSPTGETVADEQGKERLAPAEQNTITRTHASVTAAPTLDDVQRQLKSLQERRDTLSEEDRTLLERVAALAQPPRPTLSATQQKGLEKQLTQLRQLVAKATAQLGAIEPNKAAQMQSELTKQKTLRQGLSRLATERSALEKELAQFRSEEGPPRLEAQRRISVLQQQLAAGQAEQRRLLAAINTSMDQYRAVANTITGEARGIPRMDLLTKKIEVIERQLAEGSQQPLLAKLTTPLEERLQTEGPGAEAVKTRATPLQTVSDFVEDVSRGFDATQSRQKVQALLAQIEQSQRGDSERIKTQREVLNTPEQQRIVAEPDLRAAWPRSSARARGEQPSLLPGEAPLTQEQLNQRRSTHTETVETGQTRQAQQPGLFEGPTEQGSTATVFETPRKFRDFMASKIVQKLRAALGKNRPTAEAITRELEKLRAHVKKLNERNTLYVHLSNLSAREREDKIAAAMREQAEVILAIERGLMPQHNRYVQTKLQVDKANEVLNGLRGFIDEAVDAFHTALRGSVIWERMEADRRKELDEAEAEWHAASDALAKAYQDANAELQDAASGVVEEYRPELLERRNAAHERLSRAGREWDRVRTSLVMQGRAEKIDAPANFRITDNDIVEALNQHAELMDMAAAQERSLVYWQREMGKAAKALDTAREQAKNDPVWKAFLDDARATIDAARSEKVISTPKKFFAGAIRRANSEINRLNAEIRERTAPNKADERRDAAVAQGATRAEERKVLHAEMQAEQRKLEDDAAATTRITFDQKQNEIERLFENKKTKAALVDLAYEPEGSKKHTAAKEYLAKLAIRVADIDGRVERAFQRVLSALEARNKALDNIEELDKYNRLNQKEQAAVAKGTANEADLLAAREERKQAAILATEAKYAPRIEAAQKALAAVYKSPTRTTQYSFSKAELSKLAKAKTADDRKALYDGMIAEKKKSLQAEQAAAIYELQKDVGNQPEVVSEEVAAIAQTQTKGRTAATQIDNRTRRVSEGRVVVGRQAITKAEMADAKSAADLLEEARLAEQKKAAEEAAKATEKIKKNKGKAAPLDPVEAAKAEAAKARNEAKALEDELRALDEAVDPEDFGTYDPDEPLYRETNNAAYESRANTALDSTTEAAVRKGDLKGALESLAKNGSTAAVRRTAKRLAAMVENTTLKVESMDVGGDYDSKSDTVTLNGDALTEEDLLHEAGHAATLNAIDAPADSLTPEQLDARNRLEALYKKMQSRAEFAREYGAKNFKEFVAELLSNQQVRDKINRTQGLLQRIYSGFLKLLGIDLNANDAMALFQPSRADTGRGERLASVMRGVFPGTGRQFSDEVPDAVRKLVEQTVARTATLGDKITALATGMLRMRTTLVDSWAPIEQLVKMGVEKGKLDTVKALQMRVYMRLFSNYQEYTNSALLNGVPTLTDPDESGLRTIEGGNANANAQTIAKTLRKASVLGNEQAVESLFTLWMALKRAERDGVGLEKLYADEETRPKQETIDKLREMLAAHPEAEKAFAAAREQYRAYNKALLDLQVKTGVMSRETANGLGDGDYVGYYRVNSNGVVEMVMGGSKPVRIGNIIDQPYLKELVGSTQQILPFYSSMVQNTSLMMSMALKNMQHRNIANMFKDLGLGAVHKVKEGETPPVGKLRYKVNGEDWWFAADKKAFESAGVPEDLMLLGMQGVKTAIPTLVKAMAVPADVLRKSVRRMPIYTLRQTIRDPIHAWMTTGGNFVPVVSTWRELYKGMTNPTQTQISLREAAVIGNHTFSGDADDIAKMLRDMSGSGSMSVFSKGMQKLDELALNGEAATRAVLYDNFRKKGMSHVEALLHTAETMNFSRRGTSASLHWLSTMIPFFHAQIQGLDAVYRAFKGDTSFEGKMNARTALLRRGAMVSAGTMMYALAMEDDESYKNATPEERYGNWFVPIPGTKDSLRVPIPFELGLIFKSVPEAIINVAFGDKTAKDAAKALAISALRTLPVSPSNIPSAIRAPLELMTNTDFYSGQPIESAHEQALTSDQRYRNSTTEVAKLLGQVAPLSPVQIDHLVRSFTSSMGIMTLSMANFILRPLSGNDSVEKPDMALNEMPIIGPAIQPATGRGMVNAAFDDIKKFQQASTTYKELAKSDPEAAKAFANKFATEMALAQTGGKFRQQMGEFAAYKRMIASNPDLTGAEKRHQIEMIKRQEIELSRRIRELAAAQP